MDTTFPVYCHFANGVVKCYETFELYEKEQMKRSYIDPNPIMEYEGEIIEVVSSRFNKINPTSKNGNELYHYDQYGNIEYYRQCGKTGLESFAEPLSHSCSFARDILLTKKQRAWLANTKLTNENLVVAFQNEHEIYCKVDGVLYCIMYDGTWKY